MNLKNIFTLHAVILLIYGIMDLFLTQNALAMFAEGVQASPTMILTIRMMGATFLSLAVLTWFMRDAHVSHGRRAGLFCLAVGLIIASILQIMAITDGTINSMNWIGVLISTAFGVAYAYFGNKEHKMIMEREAKERAKAKA
ncbi:MAG: hypothetical protein AAFR87_24570 [Bacteroidota bacterium]